MLDNLEFDKALDGAKPVSRIVSGEALVLSTHTQDSSLNLIDRIESYEDIMYLEVGDTLLTRARNIERESGVRQLFLKFEGGNPSGTHKDRIAFAQCHDALRRGYDSITAASCGNFGAALSFAAKLAGLRCIIYIPKAYHTKRVIEIEQHGAEVLRFEGSYENSVRESIRKAEENTWYDANPGGRNTPLQLKAYAEIAHEIYDILRDAPRFVAAPVSNGTLLAGVYRGFVSLHMRGKTSRVPKMIAASSSFKNPIIYAYRHNLKSCSDLNPDKIKETQVNEPLINWHSFDGEEALYAIRESGGSAYDVSDEKMNILSRTLKNREGLNVLPAATAGLSAILDMAKNGKLEADRYVAILTGRK